MADTENATEAKRGKVAERDWINAAGDAVKNEAEATGGRYTFVRTGQSIERQFGDAGQPATMCAIMGWHTKVGNIVNSIINAADYDGVSDPMPDVAEWDAGLENGVWREVGESAARGPKYDKDVLAGALLDVLGEKAAGDFAHYRERLEDKKYYAAVRGQPTVMVRYMQRMADRGQATGGGVDALA
jgi:hypothetical protein